MFLRHVRALKEQTAPALGARRPAHHCFARNLQQDNTHDAGLTVETVLLDASVGMRYLRTPKPAEHEARTNRCLGAQDSERTPPDMKKQRE